MKLKSFYQISVLVFACLFFGCQEPKTQSNTTTVAPSNKPAPTVVPNDAKLEASKNGEAPTPTLNKTSSSKTNECKPQGKMIDENDLWIKEYDTWVCIVADSLSKDNVDFGDSYRLFDVYDTKTCQQINRTLLPVNRSPDFPYYIFKETYEAKNKVLCTAGFDFTFCYDVLNQKMLPKMQPQFLKERVGEDAQSGLPLGLVIWDHYLFGYAQDFGAYAFDLDNPNAPKSLKPAAEYKVADALFEFNSLFLIEEEKGKYQGLIPMMNEDEDAMILKKLFKKTKKIFPTLPKNTQNNRYLIFKDMSLSENGRLAIDMQKKEVIKLPTKISTGNNKTIMKWLKTQK